MKNHQNQPTKKASFAFKCFLSLCLVTLLSVSMFATPVARAKAKLSPKLWAYEQTMFSHDFLNRLMAMGFNALTRIKAKHATGAFTLLEHYTSQGAERVYSTFFYNGTVVHADPPEKDGRVDISFDVLFGGFVPKKMLKYKPSQGDKVNYLWGMVDETLAPNDYFSMGYEEPLLKHTPFRILGLNLGSLSYIVETPTQFTTVPMAKVRVLGLGGVLFK